MNAYRQDERDSRAAAGRSTVVATTPSIHQEGINILVPLMDLITALALIIWALGLKR